MDTNRILVDPQTELGCDPFKVRILQEAIKQNIINEEEPLVMFYNLERYRKGIEAMKSHFPSFWLHTMAIKSNAISSAMKLCLEMGLGFESASIGELTQALTIGASPKKIVFDSPAKKLSEIKFSLEKGIYFNIDNFQELKRVKDEVATGKYKDLNVGIRVNPQVGLGTIKEMSTSGDHSKFGIAFNDFQEILYQSYQESPWLNGIHVHVGSQGCPIDLTLKGIRKIVDIVLEINKRRGSQQIKFIDIGGGFPVNFDDENDDSEVVLSWKTYSDSLKQTTPELFSGDYIVLTEFGRRTNAKPGFFVSKVEYNKSAGGRNIAVIHAGADLCLRTVYMPTKWAVRVSVLDSEGKIKQGEKFKQDIAGPCCFASDIIAHERLLPFVEAGDYIIVHDSGAYYYSAFSYYNLRQAPPVYAVEEINGKIIFKVWKKSQTVEETIAFFQ
jgi:diaminopimelate decarboxylase